MKLKGKTAVIVGASGGIGREITKALASEGVNLILVSRDKRSLNSLSEQARNMGVKAEVLTADISKPRSIEKLSKKISKKYKTVDILVHAAGIGVYEKLEDVDIKKWQISLDLNVTAPFYLTKLLMPQLKRADKAYVLSTGSGMGKVGLSGRSAYCASKFALRGLMLSLAKEYEGTNINIVLLTLGSVLTAFGPLTKEEKVEKVKQGKKYLDPEWLGGYIVTKIKHDSFEPETSIYPRHYIEESRKDKR